MSMYGLNVSLLNLILLQTQCYGDLIFSFGEVMLVADSSI